MGSTRVFSHITKYHGNIVLHWRENLSTTATGHDITLSKAVLQQKYMHAKKIKIEAARGMPNSVTQRRKIDKFDNLNHVKNRRANNRKILHVQKYHNIRIRDHAITEVPHENLPNTTTPKNFSLLGAKNVRHYHTLPSPRQTLIPNTPLWVRVSRGSENTQRGWSRFKLTDQLQLIAGPFTRVEGASFSS